MFKLPLLKALIVHVVFCSVLLIVCGGGLASGDMIRLPVMSYSVVSICIFYFSWHRSLSNRFTYLLWLLVAIIQSGVYSFYKYKADEFSIYAPTLRPLQSLLIFLVLYQCLRQASLKFYCKEPVLLSRENYDLTALEYVFSMPLLLIPMLSCFSF